MVIRAVLRFSLFLVFFQMGTLSQSWGADEQCVCMAMPKCDSGYSREVVKACPRLQCTTKTCTAQCENPETTRVQTGSKVTGKCELAPNPSSETLSDPFTG
jgi:hypothetical protein